MNLSKVKNVDRYIGNILCAILSIFALIKKVACPLFYPVFEPKNVKKMLFIKFWGLGNMVFLMPIFKAIRNHFKDAEIDFLTLSLNRNIMQTYPHIDSIVSIDTSTFFKFITSTIRALRKIRKKRFELLVDFEIYVKISAILSFLSAACFKVGIAPGRQIRGLLYNAKILYNKDVHITKTYADLVKKIGVQISKIEPIGISTTESDERSVQDFLKKFGIEKDDILVGMHIGSGDNFIGRRWPKHNFVQLADLLIKEYDCKLFFTGSAGEKEMVKEALKMFHENKNVIDTAGQFNTRQLACLLRKMKLFVSNDTGPLHIASCMGTQVIGLYGPNTPIIYGPLGNKAQVFYKNLKCSPCITNLNSKTSYCRDFKCMKNITVKEVLEVAKRCLGG